MARVEGLRQERPGLLGRIMSRALRKRFGKVSESAQIAANLEKVSFLRGLYELALQNSNTVERRVRRLGEIKAATLVGCPA